MIEKEKLQESVEQKLEDYSEKIRKLREKSEKGSTEPDCAVQQILYSAQAQKEKVVKMLQSLHDQDGDNWGDFQSEMHAYMENIDKKLRQAMTFYNCPPLFLGPVQDPIN